MRKSLIALVVLVLVGGGVALAAAGRSNEPRAQQARSVAPRLVKCPLTGELISPDDCPLAHGAKTSDDLPPCCKGRK